MSLGAAGLRRSRINCDGPRPGRVEWSRRTVVEPHRLIGVIWQQAGIAADFLNLSPDHPNSTPLSVGDPGAKERQKQSLLLSFTGIYGPPSPRSLDVSILAGRRYGRVEF